MNRLKMLYIMKKIILNKIINTEKMNIDNYSKTIILNSLTNKYNNICDEIFEINMEV